MSEPIQPLSPLSPQEIALIAKLREATPQSRDAIFHLAGQLGAASDARALRERCLSLAVKSGDGIGSVITAEHMRKFIEGEADA